MAKANHKPVNWFDSLTDADLEQAQEMVKDIITILRRRHKHSRTQTLVLSLFALIKCHPDLEKDGLNVSDVFTDWLAYNKRKGIT